ncbi:MAG: PKD domain-containing protein [Salibacteraceae bacterium]
MAKTNHTGFENQMKDALEQLEVPYNPAHWEELSAKMDASSTPVGSGRKGWLLATGAAVLLTAGSYWMLSEDSTTLPQAKVPAAASTQMIAQTPPENATSTGLVEQPSESVVPSSSANTPEEASTISATLLESEANTFAASSEPRTVHSQSTTTSQYTAPSEVVTQPVQEAPDQVTTAPKVFSFNSNYPIVDGPQPDLPQPMVVEISSTEGPVCPQAPIPFSAKLTGTGSQFIWEFGDGHTSEEVMPIHAFERSGSYAVRLKVIDVNGEEHLSNELSIEVAQAPQISITTKMPDDLTRNPYTVLEVTSNENVQLQWDMGTRQEGLSTQETTFMGTNRVEYIFNTKGTHQVKVLAMNDAGCTSVTEENVQVYSDYNLLAPRSFNPTSPNGENLNWFPFAITSSHPPFQLTIYDRSGVMVYNTSEIAPWDGRLAQSTQRVRKGETYVWTVVTTDKDGKPMHYQGSIAVSGS